MKHTHIHTSIHNTYVHIISFIREESVLHVNTDMITLFHIRTVRCVFVCKYFYMKRLAGLHTCTYVCYITYNDDGGGGGGMRDVCRRLSVASYF